MRPIAPCAAALAVFGGLATAAEPPPTRLDTLTVEGQRAAPPALAISQVDLSATPALNPGSLRDGLRQVPGVFALNHDNLAQGLRPSIRGFGARAAFGVRGIRVRLDGVPLTLPDGQTELDVLDLARIASLRVVRGPVASVFGNAGGGLIDIRSRPVAAGTQASLRFQDADQRRLRAEYGWSGRAGRGLRLSALQAHRDGPRQHAHTDQTLAQGEIEQPLGTGELSLRANLLAVRALDPGGLSAAAVRADRGAARDRNVAFAAGEEIDQQRLSLRWRGEVGGWQLQPVAYTVHREFDNRLPFVDGGQVSFERDVAGLGLTATRARQWLGRRLHISSGLDLQWQADARRRFDNQIGGLRGELRLDQDEAARNLGGFARGAVDLDAAWRVAAGLRADRLRLSVDDRFPSDGDDSGVRDLDNLSADLSLRWQHRAMAAWLRFATAYATPTINELANPAGGGFNPDLDANQIRSLELGASWLRGPHRLEAVLFGTRSNDEFLAFELENQPGRSFFRNAGRSDREGLELSAHSAIQAWRIQLAYALLRADFAEGGNAGRRIPGLPRQTLFIQLRRSHGPWLFATDLFAQDHLYADDANQARVPGHMVWGAGVEWAVRPRLSLNLRLENLLAADYNDNIRINAFGGRYFEPAGGRSIALGARLSFD